MISKELFIKYINEYQVFEKAIERVEYAISGKKFGCNLFESDWYSAVGEMLDTFLDSHFTEYGADWIYYYLFEDVDDKEVVITKPKDIFNEQEEIKYHLNSIDELWNFLISDKERYFKNV